MNQDNSLSPAMALMGGNGAGTIWGAPRTSISAPTFSNTPKPNDPYTTMATNPYANTPTPAPSTATNPFYPTGVPYGSIPGSTDNSTPNPYNMYGATAGGTPVGYQSNTNPTPATTPPPATSNLPGPIGGGARPSTWAADYDPSKGGFQWRDGTTHGVPEPASGGSPTLPNGQTNPNYFSGGPTTDVWGNTLGSAGWGTATATPQAPTPQSPFGSNPFVKDAGYTEPYGSSGGYNPLYFATQQTADTAAKMIPGAKVIQQNAVTNAPGSPIQQNQPNWMLQLADGRTINPSFLASAFQHGYSQDYVNQLISAELNQPFNYNSLDPIAGPYTVSGNNQVGAQAPNSQGQYAPTTSFTNPYPMNGSAQQGTGQGTHQTTQTMTPGITPPAGQTGAPPVPGTQPNMDQMAQFLKLFTGLGSGSNNPFATLLSNPGISSLASSQPQSFAQLMAMFASLRGNNGLLNPLFWNSGGQMDQKSLYPSYY